MVFLPVFPETDPLPSSLSAAKSINDKRKNSISIGLNMWNMSCVGWREQLACHQLALSFSLLYGRTKK